VASPDTAPDKDAVLQPCPDSPNCVSSLATDSHRIAPLTYRDDPEHAWIRLKAAVQAQPRTTITDETAHRLHAEARSLIFRFVDDLDFVLRPDKNLIQVRSAARTGYSDLGVNRRRVERIRRDFEQQPKQ
jgi:uncharacterized protein (DUF1499 family)